jgi:ribosomal protein S18 acetylase RimI-like enzyme
VARSGIGDSTASVQRVEQNAGLPPDGRPGYGSVRAVAPEYAMTSGEELALSDLNLAESTREMARFHTDARIVEESDLLLVASCVRFPVGFTNAVVPLAESVDPERLLAVADGFFGPMGRGYTVMLRGHLDTDLEQALDAAGLQAFGDSPGMLLDAPVAPPPPIDGIDFVPLDDGAAVRDFAEVSAAAYSTIGMPEGVTRELFEESERIVRPHVLGVVAREGDVPLSTAMVILTHGIAGVYWVGTALAGRKRGLGDACTRIVSNAAFERGARAVVLQASQQGEPIYRRMGYREVTRYRWRVRFA